MLKNSRRDIFKFLGMAGAVAAAPASVGRAFALTRNDARPGELDRLPRDPALGGAPVDNPYADVDWNTVLHVPSTTHIHIQTGASTAPFHDDDQRRLDLIYNEMQLRHLPISNYRPSAPVYPIENIRTDHFIEQRFGVFHNGRYIEGPIDWNRVIMDPDTGWRSQLPPETQRRLPIRPGERWLKDIPEDVIVSANAEHWNFSDAPAGLHVCAPGSLFSSGVPTHRMTELGMGDHGYNLGSGLPWREAFRQMLEQLVFADGGGITINHPVGSKLSDEDVCQYLDFDPRVLGIEVYNHPVFPDPSLGWSVTMWDRILATGRRCLGFFVPDHGVNGRSMLLVSKYTEEECLRAYRKGAFYGSPAGSKLAMRFDSIRLAGGKLSMVVSGVPKGEWIIAWVTTNLGTHWINGSPDEPIEFEIPLTEEGVPEISYVRAEVVRNLTMEHIFTQPIRFPRLA